MGSIAVIGCGYVGGSLATVFNEHGYIVYAYDKTGYLPAGGQLPNPFFIIKPSSDLIGGRATENLPGSIGAFTRACEAKKHFKKIYFVCVPTPMKKDGSADLSIVEGVLNELAACGGERTAVVKSTVPPGSTERWNAVYGPRGLHIVFNPEFLREISALDDMRNPTRILLGGQRQWTKNVKQLYLSVFPTVSVVRTSSTNAELVKYVTNCFLATKVSFANEIYQICEALDAAGLNADYDRVIECAIDDERLGRSHWRVPSFELDEKTGEPLLGYGGSCLTKDINALICLAKEFNVDPKVMTSAWKKNEEVRPGRDWEKLVGRAVNFSGKKEE